MEIHGGAGAGGDDDGQLAGEHGGGVAGDFTRGHPVAGIEGRLAAAGLVFRKLDGHAEVFEDFDGGPRDVVVKGIAEAGAHEEDTFVGGSLEWAGHGRFEGY